MWNSRFEGGQGRGGGWGVALSGRAGPFGCIGDTLRGTTISLALRDRYQYQAMRRGIWGIR